MSRTIPATVKQVTLVQSPNTGTRGVRLDLGTEDGATLIHTIWITEKSAGMAHGQLKFIGFDSHVQSIREAPMFCDAKVWVELAPEEYKGKVTEKVQRLVPDPSNVGPDQDADAIDSLLKTVKPSEKGGSKSHSAKSLKRGPPPETAPNPGEENIPF
jgi:hypothetical protein